MPEAVLELRDLAARLGIGIPGGLDSHPLHASIELTHRCNLLCGHCYIPLTHARRAGEVSRTAAARRQELTTERWLAIFDELIAAGCLSVLLTGGDPLLRRDFAELYRHLRRGGVCVTIFTNGILITEDLAELFRAYPPAKIEISLYGASEATYRRVTGIPGSLARARAGIERLRARGLPFELKTVATQGNRHELATMRELAADYGSAFSFSADVFPRFDLGAEPERERLSADAAACAKMEDDFHRRAYEGRPTPSPSADRGDALFVCKAGIQSLSIAPDGQAHFCLLLRRDSFDLARMSLAEAWQKVAALRRATRTRRSRCHGCTLRDVCVVCPARAYLETGDCEEPSDSICRDAFETASALGRKLADWETFIAERRATAEQAVESGVVDGG